MLLLDFFFTIRFFINRLQARYMQLTRLTNFKLNVQNQQDLYISSILYLNKQ